MLSVSNLLCGHEAGNEELRYGHTHRDAAGRGRAAEGHTSHAATYPEDGVPRPVVVWAVTRACNLRCVHCYAAATEDAAPNELTHEEGIALLDDLKKFNAPAVLFSGGEPLARPDLLELIGHARKIGLASTLSTNGLYITDQIAAKLAALGLRYVGVSIDGKREQHDKLRGLKGAFDGALEGVQRCKENGIKVGLRFTVHSLNAADMDAIFDLCIERGIDRLCIYHLAYAGRGDRMQGVDLTAQQTRDIVDHIFARTIELHEQNAPLEVLTVGNHVDAAYTVLRLAETNPERAEAVRARLSGTGGNRSGCNIASIDPVGGVHYDQFSWHYTCGNVREAPFSQIWSEAADPRLAVLRDRRSQLPQRCQECRFINICNGNLRTRAEAATGNWMAMDPSCYLTDEEVRSTPTPQSAGV